MRHLSNSSIFGTWALALALGACAPKEGPTQIREPHGEHPSFAEEYPSALQGALDGYAKDEAEAEALSKELADFPKALKEPNWPFVQEVYEAAEEDGESGYYGEVLATQRAHGAYYDELKPDLVKRAGGAVDYETKKNKCEGEYFGAVSRGLDKGFETHSEDRLNSASRAQSLIAQRGSELPRGDQDTLKEQAQKIALAIYLVNISLPERHARLSQLEAERSKVEGTLKKRKKELDETPLSPKASAEAKKNREEELKRIADAETKLDSPHAAAKQRLETSEKAIADAQDHVEDAVKALKKAVKDKAALKELD